MCDTCRLQTCRLADCRLQTCRLQTAYFWIVVTSTCHVDVKQKYPCALCLCPLDLRSFCERKNKRIHEWRMRSSSLPNLATAYKGSAPCFPGALVLIYLCKSSGVKTEQNSNRTQSFDWIRLCSAIEHGTFCKFSYVRFCSETEQNWLNPNHRLDFVQERLIHVMNTKP